LAGVVALLITKRRYRMRILRNVTGSWQSKR
jgi:hypothetical protein